MSIVRIICLVFFSVNTWAGFLDMPEIEEVPEAENDILLKDLDIPPVRDRIPNPEAGPRINVTAFRVQGIVEFPELGITRESLIELVESSRFNIMKEGKMLYSGYTQEELSQLQDLIVDIEKDTRDEHVGPLDVQRLVFLIRDQRRRRGVTLGMLEDVADKVTNYYRQRGFILAKAFIPEQRVRDGVVTLTLLLGDLGQIELVNSKRYSHRVAERIFDDAMHKPVTTGIMEQKLYYLNDMPGLSVQGFFGPGEQVGDTKLTVRTLSEETYNANFRLDNHGSDSTGEYRLYGDFILNNPLSYGDRLHLSILAAREPQSALFGSLRYGGPLFWHRIHYDFGVSKNAFVLGLEQKTAVSSEQGGGQKITTLKIGGDSLTYDLGVDYQITRSRINNTKIGLRGLHIDAKVSSDGNGTHDVVDNVQLNYTFDFLDEASKVIHNGALYLTRSFLKESRDEFENVWLLSYDYTYLRFLNPHFGLNNLRWLVKSGAQYAGEKLSSINQYSLSGPTRSRAYKTNTFFADNAFYLGSDLIFDAPKWLPLNESLQPYVFFDFAYGETDALGGNDSDLIVPEEDSGIDEDDLYDTESVVKKNTAKLFDVGMGFKFSFFEKFKGNFSIAKPLNTKISVDLDIEEVEEVKAYLDIQYSL